MSTTTVPMLESSRTVRLTPSGTAHVAAYRLVRALADLSYDDRSSVLKLVEEELAALPV